MMFVSIPPVVKKRRLRANDAEVFVGEPAAEGAGSSFPKPANESQRLAALRSLNILDTAPEIAYDEIAELAAQICGCPVGYISFIDDHRRWLKANFSRSSMEKRWQQGRSDAGTVLHASPWLAPAPKELGVRVFDVLREDSYRRNNNLPTHAESHVGIELQPQRG